VQDTKGEDDQMNIIDVIQEQILRDDECIEKKANDLDDEYDSASESEKKIIDNVFIHLTGWTYKSLKNL
jgi:hypothetical protein